MKSPSLLIPIAQRPRRPRRRSFPPPAARLTAPSSPVPDAAAAGTAAPPPDHLADLASDVEYVKPLKMSPEGLHEHDLMYEEEARRGAAAAPPIRHHSGHFRHMAAEVWDPYPRYELVAFGRRMRLELGHRRGFVPPELHVTQYFENFTLRTRHDPRVAGCFYGGRVRGDEGSDIAVSLCGGMVSDGRWFWGGRDPVRDMGVRFLVLFAGTSK